MIGRPWKGDGNSRQRLGSGTAAGRKPWAARNTSTTAIFILPNDRYTRRAKKHAIKVKVKVTWIYMAPSRETSKALRHGSHSFTCKLHHACLYRVSVHQMALPLTCYNVRLAAYYSSKDERLSWPNWLTYSRRFTHITRQPLLSCGVRPSVRLSVRHVRESCQNE